MIYQYATGSVLNTATILSDTSDPEQIRKTAMQDPLRLAEY